MGSDVSCSRELQNSCDRIVGGAGAPVQQERNAGRSQRHTAGGDETIHLLEVLEYISFRYLYLRVRKSENSPRIPIGSLLSFTGSKQKPDRGGGEIKKNAMSG